MNQQIHQRIFTKYLSQCLCVVRKYSSHPNLIRTLLNMPREGKDISELKKIRLKIKEKGLKYPPGTVTLQVLGSGAFGAPKSLYVFTDQSRYLFNVGEGTQRLAHEHKMKLSKLEHIFITFPTWENIGGLPGVSLTIQDVGVTQIFLHGPEGTDDLFPATRRFVVLKDLSVQMADMSSDFEDNVMSVKYVPVASKNSTPVKPLNNLSLNEADDVDYYGHERRKKGVPPAQAAVNHVPLPELKERIGPVAMCYICKLHTKPGTLNLEACVERGVPPGPLLGRLKSGENIVLPSGVEVKSCDVTTPSDPGPLFVIVDCPSEDYLQSLTSSKAFDFCQSSSPSTESHAFAVVHFTPPDVTVTEEYKKWTSKFPETTTHLYVNTGNQCTGSVAVHRLQYKLNMIHPGIFPLLKDAGIEVTESLSDDCDMNDVINDSSVAARTLTSLHLRPRRGLDLTQTLKLAPQDYMNEPFNTIEFKEELLKFKEISKNHLSNEDSYPKIVFLGTGSCIPNKTRNTSGILIHMTPTDSVILDCGEGTFIQIVRLFGYEGAKRILQNLKMVYVSHLHADHHIGLVGLLKGRRKMVGSDAKPVHLLAPQQIMHWLTFYHARFEDILQEFTLVPNSFLCGGHSRFLTEDLAEFMKSLHCRDIGTVFVRHCPNAFGVAITHETGWKLTYSGDTMPCQDLVALGQDSDILIHEATMEDDLAAEAKQKYHSTTSEAIEVGQAMRARFILLTHFSQRYAKLPVINESFHDNVGIAFDNMQVSMDELPLLPKMYPALKAMFAEDCEEMEARTHRRHKRLEMKRAASDSPNRNSKIQIS